MIAQSKATVGLCPMTEANLGDGVFPLKEFLQQNGQVAIGSDSHILINPFQEMQILEYSQRLHNQQRVIASSQETHNVGTLLWNESVFGGANCCQLPIMGIKTGQTANWLSLDTKHPLLTSMNGATILDTITFAHNQINTKPYLKGQKHDQMTENIVQNYKNTLKSLR